MTAPRNWTLLNFNSAKCFDRRMTQSASDASGMFTHGNKLFIVLLANVYLSVLYTSQTRYTHTQAKGVGICNFTFEDHEAVVRRVTVRALFHRMVRGEKNTQLLVRTHCRLFILCKLSRKKCISSYSQKCDTEKSQLAKNVC